MELPGLSAIRASPLWAQVSAIFGDNMSMGIMSEIDIMRREGAREPEDFEAHGYNRQDSEAMSEVVKAAEPFEPTPTCGTCDELS